MKWILVKCVQIINIQLFDAVMLKDKLDMVAGAEKSG